MSDDRRDLLDRLEASQKACFDAGQHVAAMDIQSARAALSQRASAGPADVLERILGAAHSGALLGGDAAYQSCLTIEAAIGEITAQAAPSRPGNAESSAVRLVDWAYLYATEGGGWPDDTTISAPLIELAERRAPTQADADLLKAGGSLKDLLALPTERVAIKEATAPEPDRLRLALDDALNRGDWVAKENADQAIRLAADDYPKRREGWVR